MGKNYLVQPIYIQARNADYDTLEKVNAAFETIKEKDYPKGGTNANLGSSIFINKKTKKSVFGERPNLFEDKKAYEKFFRTNAHLFEAISSALALYRLICIFPNPKFVSMGGSADYKMPWEMLLRHKETGEIVGFGEWKGGFNIRGTKNKEEYNEKTMKDFEMLVNLIMSQTSPHPYDGTVAGSVA